MTGAIGAAVAAHLGTDVPMLVLVLDDAGTIVDANPYTQTLLGGDLIGAPVARVLVAPALDLAAIGAAPQTRSLSFATFIGLPQSYRCSLVRAGAQIVVVGGAEPEETERLRRESLLLAQEVAVRNRELQKANAALARLDRLKTWFLGTAAHDLRSPLSAVMLSAELLQDAVGASGERELVDAILEAGTTMRELIDKFLDVALIEAGRFRIERTATHPEALVERTVSQVTPTAAQRGIAVVATVEPTLAAVELDAQRIQQALVNVLVNAIQHSPEGATVALDVRCASGHLHLVVRDAGPGIPPEIQARLFTPFAPSGDRKSSGERSTGLGLAITHAIVDGHHGTIAVASAPDTGTTFTIRIPVGTGP